MRISRISHAFIFYIYFSTTWPKSTDHPTKETVQTWILHYRGIYILNNTCNKAFGKILFPFFKMCIVIIIILSFYACVRLYEFLDIFSMVFVGILVFTSSVLIAPIASVTSSLYTISQTFSQNLKPKLRFTGSEQTERVLKQRLRSCPIIRCQVGTLYFMESSAKLTLIQNVVNGIVFLLVNTKAK